MIRRATPEPDQPNCPETELLYDYIVGLLPDTGTAEVKEHLDGGCTHCTSEVHLLRKTWEAGQVELDRPDADLIEQLLSIPQRHPRAPEYLPSDFGVELLSDSAEQPELAGVRRTGLAAPRELRYRAGLWNLRVRIESDGPRAVVVTGQLAAQGYDDLSAVEVILERDGVEEDRDECDPTGEFSLDASLGKALELIVRAENAPELRIRFPG